MRSIRLGGQPTVQQTLFEAQHAPAVTVYTDGGCDPNPGPGGWAAILDYGDHEVVLSGNALDSTNNRMEIEAAISALAFLLGRHGRARVDLHTDSRYLRQGITEWIDDWFARGWVTKAGAPVKNQDAWRRLYELSHAHAISWHWTKGHAGDPLNERGPPCGRRSPSGNGVRAQPLPGRWGKRVGVGLAAKRLAYQERIGGQESRSVGGAGASCRAPRGLLADGPGIRWGRRHLGSQAHRRSRS
jgi:ribonuclease HI